MTDAPARTEWGPAPSLDDIAGMARKALDTLEEPFRTHAKAVAIKVEDFADEETLAAMKIESPYDLTGLYSGVALTLELHSAPSTIPPMVWLYRLPILDEWAATGDVTLEELVAGLNSLGVGPRDLISILQSIKTAGAMQADIMVQ